MSHFCHHLMFKTWVLFISLVLLNWDWKLRECNSGIGQRPDAIGQDFRVSEIMLWLLWGWFFVSAVLSKWTISDKYRQDRARIYSKVLWDIQGNTARTHRWQRKWGSLEFGPKAINHRNSDYSLYLTWICTLQSISYLNFYISLLTRCFSWTVTVLSFLWHFAYFFFLSHLIWGAQDNFSLFKGNITTSQSSPYWWVDML